MSAFEIYRDDLLNRYEGHTFTETPVGSMTNVEFKDSEDGVVLSSQKLTKDDAYRDIRINLVGSPDEILLTLSESQKDALTGPIPTGCTIFESGTGILVYYSDSWTGD